MYKTELRLKIRWKSVYNTLKWNILVVNVGKKLLMSTLQQGFVALIADIVQ